MSWAIKVGLEGARRLHTEMEGDLYMRFQVEMEEAQLLQAGIEGVGGFRLGRRELCSLRLGWGARRLQDCKA